MNFSKELLEARKNGAKPERYSASPAVWKYVDYVESLERWEKDQHLLEGCRRVRESYARGYISRVSAPILREYKGQYGIGYVVSRPAYGTTRYHLVEYWVQKKYKARDK